MLSDPNASYLPSSYKFQHDNGWDFAVKTGTTNDNFDGLMTSWSTQFAVVSWVGYHTRNKTMTAGEMEYMTEPLTRGLMEAAHEGLKPVNWVQPSDIKVEPAFVVRNHVGIGSVEPSPSTEIYPSWYQVKGKNTSETVDKVSGLLATTCTPADAKEYESNSNTSSFSIDEFVNGTIGKSTAPITANDNVHNCNDSPPTITLTAPGTCTDSCTITATITQGTHLLSDPQYPQFPGTVDFKLGGSEIYSTSVSDSPSTVSFTYNPTASGSDTLTATVTDSVLYQGSASAPLTYSANTSSPITITSPSANANVNGAVPVSWSGGTSGANFSVAVNGNQECQTTNTTCSVGLPGPPGTFTITVSDDKSDPSSSVTVTKQ